MIGGEFQLRCDDISYSVAESLMLPENEYAFSSGRAALYHILQHLKSCHHVTELLLPDYLCHTITETTIRAGIRPIFYPLTPDFTPSVDWLDQYAAKASPILVINYYGISRISEIVQVLRTQCPERIIILDDVQALFHFIQNNDDVDFSFTSLRKSMAAPDGSLVKTKHKLYQPQQGSRFPYYKIAAAFLKSLRSQCEFDDTIYLNLFEKGEEYINSDIDSAMTPIAMSIYQRFDVFKAAKKRKQNAKHLLDGLKNLDLHPLIPVESGTIPLFLPLYLKNRDTVRKHFFMKKIFCPIHWPIIQPELQMGKNMAEHEISLIVDQRYGADEMEQILNIIRKMRHEC